MLEPCDKLDEDLPATGLVCNVGDPLAVRGEYWPAPAPLSESVPFTEDPGQGTREGLSRPLVDSTWYR